MRTWQRILPVTIPGTFVFKDILATLVVLSNEPGISARKAFYYSVALLPGSLLASNGVAPLANIVLGFLVGLVLYLWLRGSEPTADESNPQHPVFPNPGS